MPTSVLAPITGTVWRIEVSPGDKVEEGDTLVLLESMKMEMPVESPTAGQVESVLVREGQPIDEGAILLTIV